MKLTVVATALAFALSGSVAMAQPSQGKAGSDNGPTSNAPPTGSMNQGAAGGQGTMNQGTTGASGMNSGTTGANMGDARNPSGQGNVGPGTDNNAGKK